MKYYGMNNKFDIRNNIWFCVMLFFVEIKYDYFFFLKVFYILEKRKDNDLIYYFKCRLGKFYIIGFRY